MSLPGVQYSVAMFRKLTRAGKRAAPFTMVLAMLSCGTRSDLRSEGEVLSGAGGAAAGTGTTRLCTSPFASASVDGQTIQLTGKCYDGGGGPGAGYTTFPGESESTFAVTACNTGGEYLHMTTDFLEERIGTHSVDLVNFDYRDGSTDYIDAGPGSITVEALDDDEVRGRFEVSVWLRFGGAATTMTGSFCVERWPDNIGP